MNAKTKAEIQGKHQDAGEIQIPKLGEESPQLSAAQQAALAREAAAEAADRTSGAAEGVVAGAADPIASSMGINSVPEPSLTQQTQAMAQHQAAMAQQAAALERQQQQPGSLAELQEKVRTGEIKAMNRPAAFRYKDADAAFEPNSGRMDAIELPTSGSLGEGMFRPDLVIEEERLDFATEAFMNEFVIINVAESSNPTDEKAIWVSINGRGLWIPRGVDCVVRRCYVEWLLRCKPIGYESIVRRKEDGDYSNLMKPSSSLRYPFQVVRDDNKLGPAWRRHILAQKH